MPRVPLTGLTLLDNEQDKAGASPNRRWRIFRSTVAFALQETFPLTILWQPDLTGQEALLERLTADIRLRAAERGRHLPIRPVGVRFPDPFDLQGCFQVLWEALVAEPRGNARFFLNLNNGTHTMKMAMFLLATWPPQGLPIHLLQVFRDRAVADPLAGCTFAAQARRLDLRWENLPPLERQVRQEKEEIYRAVSLKHSRHPEVERLYREIVDIGCFTDDLLLLTGPTGTGKSRIAEEIHRGWARQRARTRSPFLELNAAGLSGDLIRSTLFGHVKGAFTGAQEDRDGFLVAADGGTLFLDEIGELDLRSQAELLLAIETKSFFPVGSTQPRKSDFRLICATNRDLQDMVRSGSFREDLHTRIRCWEFRLPGIRDLPDDFEANLDYQVRLANSEEFRRDNPQPFQAFFVPRAKAAYLAFGTSAEALWTGNFRDLRFSVRRLTTKARLQEGPITLPLVEEEISRLRALWQTGFSPTARNQGSSSALVGERFKLGGHPRNTTPRPPTDEGGRHSPPSGISARDGDIAPPLLPAPTGEMALPDLLAHLETLARRRHPERNLIDALEATLLESGLKNLGNRARAARWLYEAPDRPLSNPSNRFRERFRSLFPENR